jgi:glycosyltransferase involved in cell wall biosynthesis
MISIIIPTYNEEKFIEITLKALDNQTIARENYEIIIVDGKSIDKTVKIAKKYADKIIMQKSNGIGGARNDGVKAAKYELIATTDADVLVPTYWLERILKKFEDKKFIAVCGPDEPIEKNVKSMVTYFMLNTIIRVMTLFNLYCLGGTSSAFRKQVFLTSGGYREDLPYCDDAELGFRLRKIGKIYYDKNNCVKISVRRMEKNGYLNTLLTWLKGDLKLLLGYSLKRTDYSKQEY